jgi:hypothetical protein
MFLQTMVMYPPVMSVEGFTNVDRGLFRAVSNLTKELERCKKQVRLFLLRNNVRINLQTLRRKISASSTRYISIFDWKIQSHFCQSVFINGRSEPRSTEDFRSFTAKSANVRKDALYLCPLDILL